MIKAEYRGNCDYWISITGIDSQKVFDMADHNETAYGDIVEKIMRRGLNDLYSYFLQEREKHVVERQDERLGRR